MIKEKEIIFYTKKIAVPIIFIITPLLLTYFSKDINFIYGFELIIRRILGLELDDYTHFKKILENYSWFNLKIFISVTLTFILYFIVRKINKEKSFNDGVQYISCHYSIIYLAGKILNYKTVDLVNIAIPLQYKVILNNTFRNIKADENIKVIKEEYVEAIPRNMDIYSPDLNLLLSDTYNLNYEKLPEYLKDKPTVLIKRNSSNDKTRVFSPDFIKKIRNEVDKYNKEYLEINLFAFTNTKHNKEIANECFKICGREKLEKLNVYQYDRKSSKFDKYLTIKL